MHLPDIRAIVTGGVSGLGLAVAQHLVGNGGRVALLDVNDDKGAAAVAQLGADNAHYFRTDVTDEAGVIATVDAAHGFLGGLNAAISCAGILGSGRVLGRDGAMPLAQFQTTVMVNLIGSFNVAKAAAALMQHNTPGADGERGVIVNTASVAAYEGQIGQAAYSSGRPKRGGQGTCACSDSRTSWLACAIIGVSKMPGAIVQTRMPKRASSRAIGNVIAITPPLDAE